MSIGFHNNDHKEEEDKKAEKSSILVELIECRYAPTGNTEDICFKDTLELAYEFEGMVGAKQTKDIAEALRSHGFNFRVIDDKVKWILYEKNLDTER